LSVPAITHSQITKQATTMYKHSRISYTFITTGDKPRRSRIGINNAISTLTDLGGLKR